MTKNTLLPQRNTGPKALTKQEEGNYLHRLRLLLEDVEVHLLPCFWLQRDNEKSTAITPAEP